ncbi:alpha-galactosidase [Streptomyces sp. NPDC047917]|uniref:alpha-galactosidase n=1 Tax=Streptomyces sp. NPDC047917 TaxID=3365491 RepID=UPI0037139632
MLERTQGVRPADCGDPLARRRINRWTTQLEPLELPGTHIAPPRSHTTARTHDLSFRAATALFGHMGVEWDVRAADEREHGSGSRCTAPAAARCAPGGSYGRTRGTTACG